MISQPRADNYVRNIWSLRRGDDCCERQLIAVISGGFALLMKIEVGPKLWISGLAVAIVADGMGGHQAGDVASQLAVDTFREALLGTSSEADSSMEEGKLLIRQAILQANEVVFDMASRNEQYHNMGTTSLQRFVQPENGVIGHIGDSRAYKWRDGVLSQLTEDHTLVNELVKSGQISLEEAAVILGAMCLPGHSARMQLIEVDG